MNGNLLTDRSLIRDMWADHFEALGSPSVNEHFDNAFLNRVVSGVREIFDSCTNNPFRVLYEPLDYHEVACVCSELKVVVTGLCIDYEHIRFAGPPCGGSCLNCIRISMQMAVCECLKTGIILPLFKGKGTKADNNRVPTPLKILEKSWIFSRVFQAWKSPGKMKYSQVSWKSPGKFLRIRNFLVEQQCDLQCVKTTIMIIFIQV